MEKKVIKVSAKQLKTIIAEEASRYKKILELKRKKDAVISQLREMYEPEELQELVGEDGMDEGVMDTLGKIGQSVKKAVGMKSTEEIQAEKKANTLKAIASHPAKKAMYFDIKNKNPERLEKYIQYMTNHPFDKEGVSWDEKQQNFIPLSDVGLSDRPLTQRLAAGTGTMTGGGGGGQKMEESKKNIK